ncbi:hypothetical protein D3C80_2003450 [compost metagenome]
MFLPGISKDVILVMLAVKTWPSITPLSIFKSISACSKFGSGIEVYCANPEKLDNKKENKMVSLKKLIVFIS